jgi:tRNA uridine 5-carboxymethylaminomethyl modification enzyme
MIDDLVTRGTREPYRMFTSRAEYRLMLREDNADLRLMEMGHQLGLIPGDTARMVRERKKKIQTEIKRIKGVVIKPTEDVNTYLRDCGTEPIRSGIPLDQLLKRAELDYDTVRRLAAPPEPLNGRVTGQVEIEVKYEGYIRKQHREIEKFKDLDRLRIPETFDYMTVHGLSNELKEKLSTVKPDSLGQASRIDGITPAAISVLMIALKAGNSR